MVLCCRKPGQGNIRLEKKSRVRKDDNLNGLRSGISTIATIPSGIAQYEEISRISAIFKGLSNSMLSFIHREEHGNTRNPGF